MHSRSVTFSALLFCASLAASAQVAREFPPQLLDSFSGIPLDGGRVQSIAVNPQHANEIVIACELGGLWKTLDGSASWSHLDGLMTVFAEDVAYSPDGATLVATLFRDNQAANGGGIYISRDGGSSWTRPASATPPSIPRIPARAGAYGVSFAPDIAGRIYVGTDYGVAVSTDNGATWAHTQLDPTLPVDGDRFQDRAMSVVALSGGRAAAASRHGIYLKQPGSSATWTRIRTGSFDPWGSIHVLDRSPLVGPDQLFVIQDYSTLLLYEINADRWTSITLPGGGSRWPFVRVARSASDSAAVDIWYGAGTTLKKATRTGVAQIRTTAPADWITLGRAEGLHDDSGYLGLDGNARPVLYGSDGGVFKPTNPDATAWTRAATAAGQMNSYQITDLAASTGLITLIPGFTRTSLYFTTQDNAIWASPDEGGTWPDNDCAEGFHIRTSTINFVGEDTVAYGKVGCGPSSAMFSNANLLGARAVPEVDAGGASLTNMSSAFLVTPRNWVRYRTAPAVDPEIFVSTNDGLNWRRRASVSLAIEGVFQPSAVITPSPVVYAPFRGARSTPDGRARRGLIRLDDALAEATTTFTDSDLIYLPDDGSLGLRATQFDWHAVYAVDPRDPGFLIAPDIINGVMKISTTGGASWTTDSALTSLVTDGGRLLFFDEDAYHMQVTHIAFDPFNTNRILVGTRDAGIILSEDRGARWRRVVDSQRALYVTGFAFKNSGWPVYASTYGRGLWRIDAGVIRLPFPLHLFCPLTCLFWHPHSGLGLPWDEQTLAEREVVALTGGHVTGLTATNEGMQITVTPGTKMQDYDVTGKGVARVTILESEKPLGFGDFAGAVATRAKGQFINALVFEGAELVALIASSGDFAATDNRKTPPDDADSPATPYLFVSTDLPITGLPVIGENNILHIWASDFAPVSTAAITILIDGTGADVQQKQAPKGRLNVDVKVPPNLSTGEHHIDLVQKTAEGELRATATFVKAVIDDFGKKQQAQ